MPEPRSAFTTLVDLHLRGLRGQIGALMVYTLALPLALAAALNTISPLASPFAPGSLPSVTEPIAPGMPDAMRAALVIAPALVVALLGASWVVLPQMIARMREREQFHFFSSFAVGRVTFVLALLAAYAIATLPGAVLVPLTISYVLKVTPHPSLWLVVALPLAFVGLAATGMCLGLLRLAHAASAAVSTAAYVVTLGALWLLGNGTEGVAHTLLLLLPGSLASDLFIATAPHAGVTATALDVVGLLLYAAGGGYLAYRLLPWRVEAAAPQTQMGR